MTTLIRRNPEAWQRDLHAPVLHVRLLMSVKRCIDFISEALVFCIVLRDNGLYTTIRIGYPMRRNDLSVTFIVTNRSI